MKTILNQSFIISTALLMFAACKKDADVTYMDVVTFPPSLTASTGSGIALSADNLDSSVIISWATMTFRVQAPVTYTLQMNVPSDTDSSSAWANTVNIWVGKDVLSKCYQGTDFNTVALSRLVLPADSASTIVTRVKTTFDHDIYSNAVVFTVTPSKVFVANVLYTLGAYQN